LNTWYALLLALLAKRPCKKKGRSAPHSWRTTQLLTCFGWLCVEEPYWPGQPSALRGALRVEDKTTPAAHETITRCGALAGSFQEARDTLQSLTGIVLSTSKVRSTTLAAGAKIHDKMQNPALDIRVYDKPPAGAVTRVERTLVGMADGGGVPCCKADTRDVKGKDGEASTRQIRAGLFGEYEWLDKDGRPLFYKDSFSYFVCGEGIGEFASQMKKHGVSRGSGTVARLHCMADGEPALENAFRDAFPRAVFTNDFYHACGHLHDCIAALLPDAASCAGEYRHCRGLLYRHGAASAIQRLRKHYESGLASNEAARGHLGYLETRQANMCYGELRRQGFHIDTGHIEAAIRVLMIRRMKQAGMHWRHINALHIAALHAQYRSNKAA
jgi:hypothetical protein